MGRQAMTTRAMSTVHAASPARSVGSRGAGKHHLPSLQTATHVLGDVAIIAVTLALAVLIAAMLFAPMLP
jgi:hypothetical protein